MAYTNSFLPKEAAYYTLRNATLSNGILTINAGGSVELPLTEKLLVYVTKTFSFNYQLNYPLDIYAKITLVFDFKLDDGKCQTLSVFPSSLDTNVHSIILSTLDGKLVEGTISITSEATCQFNIWELCPEASNAEIQTVINGVEQSLPKLLYDYNTWPLQVDEYEQTISVITCRLLDNTDIQGHFSMTGMASESAILTLRFYDNEAEELFAPLEYDIRVGYNSVGVPHSYLARLAGIHSFIVTAQVTTGTIDIDTRGILFTIDGGYLAAREITIGMDVCDLTIKQTSINSSPEEIWLIGIDAGEAFIRKRSYSDQNTNVGFEPVSSLGKAKDGAIEFDGKWVLRDKDEKFTLETEDQPWYFWVDENNKLIGQLGEDEIRRVVLDTEVSQVSACKGYSSNFYLEQDQGLVVAYIKNNKAFYRQYVYDTGLKAKHWLDAELLTTEPVESLHVHRLNDYRLGFELSNNSKNIWLYTSRTYVAQAVPREIISPSYQENLAMLYCPADTDLSVSMETSVSEDILTIQLLLNRELVCYDSDMRNVITFDEDSLDYSDIEKISFKNDSEGSIITIKLNKRPKKLITNIYVNKDKLNDLQCKIETYGTIVCPFLTATVDTTVYRHMTLDEVIKFDGGKSQIKFIPVGQSRYKPEVEVVQFTESAANLIYSPVGQSRYKDAIETISFGVISENIVYTQSGSSPI